MTRSMTDDRDLLLKPLNEPDYQDSFDEMAIWLQRVQQAQHARSTQKPPLQPPAWVQTWRFKLLATCLLGLLIIGFIPIQEEDIVGYLIYWTAEGSPDAVKQEVAPLGLPIAQLVAAPHPEAPTNRFILLLPDATESNVEMWMNQLRSNNHFADVQQVTLQETINRPIYEAFFAQLPGSLSEGFLSKASVDRMRFRTLAALHVSAWLDTPDRTYHLAFGTRNDSLWFSVRPYGQVSTAQERLFDEVQRMDRALRQLQGDAPRVQQARALLESHLDSLETIVMTGGH
ncbi:MAG TPA: hypothetical protein VKP65_10885 [Rhodothermales bacterium]|nr:hypothetical protein [Rhodothermales bacterium]